VPGEKRLQFAAKFRVCPEEGIPVELPAGLYGIDILEDEFQESVFGPRVY
jgi:hypothetical protein